MRSLPRIALVGATLGLVAVALSPATAYAHGFGERYDLPVPLWLYVTGAGAAVALSFVVIGVFMRGDPGGRGYPRLNLLRWPPFRLLTHPVAIFPLQLASAGLFLPGGRRRTCGRTGTHRQSGSRAGVDSMVGGPGLRVGAGGQRVGPHQPLEDYFWLGGMGLWRRRQRQETEPWVQLSQAIRRLAGPDSVLGLRLDRTGLRGLRRPCPSGPFRHQLLNHHLGGDAHLRQGPVAPTRRGFHPGFRIPCQVRAYGDSRPGRSCLPGALPGLPRRRRRLHRLRPMLPPSTA